MQTAGDLERGWHTCRRRRGMSRRERMNQQEVVYKTMKNTGMAGLVMGVLTIVFGVSVGVVMIVNGAKLLFRKQDVLI